MNAAKVLEDLKRRFPNEPEYHQAVEEVLSTIDDSYTKVTSYLLCIRSITSFMSVISCS